MWFGDSQCVAFLLLIFFLVTTVFPKDRGLSLILPDKPGEVTPRNVLQLMVNASGAITVRHGDNPQTQSIRADAVGPLWRQNVARNPSLIALVRTSPDAAYGRMIDVLDQLRAAGARRVSLQMDGN